jgi:hypothetical protein
MSVCQRVGLQLNLPLHLRLPSSMSHHTSIHTLMPPLSTAARGYTIFWIPSLAFRFLAIRRLMRNMPVLHPTFHAAISSLLPPPSCTFLSLPHQANDKI